MWCWTSPEGLPMSDEKWWSVDNTTFTCNIWKSTRQAEPKRLVIKIKSMPLLMTSRHVSYEMQASDFNWHYHNSSLSKMSFRAGSGWISDQFSVRWLARTCSNRRLSITIDMEPIDKNRSWPEMSVGRRVRNCASWMKSMLTRTSS